MPEYLAPGVYVEETSFRSKSIEGVGTSTTAFVGPTLQGPSGVTPPLITNFADFERIYGGLGEIDGRTNYIAHAVKAYFDNGGSRLYVSRVVPSGAAKAQSENLLSGSDVDVSFTARFPGPGGNGVIELFEKETPISSDTLGSAPVGSILRLGGSPGQPAVIKGSNAPPFALFHGGQLLLTVNGEEKSVEFHGRSAEVRSSEGLPDPLELPANTLLEVQIGGTDSVTQKITLPAGNDLDALLAVINRDLKGGYAVVEDNRLVLGTEKRGSDARIQVTRAPEQLHLPLHVVSNTSGPENNVRNLDAVSLEELNALLKVKESGVNALLVDGKLALRTIATGESSILLIRAGEAGDLSVHENLGLTPTPEDAPVKGSGKEGTLPTYYHQWPEEDWKDKSGTQLPEQIPSHPANLLTLTVITRTADGVETTYEDLGFSPHHPRWLGDVLSETPTRRSDDLSNPYALVTQDTVDPLVLRNDLEKVGSQTEKGAQISLTGGSSGGEPNVSNYKDALEPLKALEEISIVAAPGYSSYTTYLATQEQLLTFVSRRRSYQIVVLDPPPNVDLTGARAARARIDSSQAALYYPWVVVANPLSAQPAEIPLPPSGFICGIYGRNDAQRGVFKAPANEVVLGALRFERDINFEEQGILNPMGINCLRFFPGRGYRVWGARTASSDPEFKYVNVRRYFNYLEASIDRSTQWAVFEPNGERLWANIRETVSSFLYNEWVSGALLGESVAQAFFVRCDRSTMTQNDLDNGRLICLIGVAVVKPAEFVIFRIGQKTADSRS